MTEMSLQGDVSSLTSQNKHVIQSVQAQGEGLLSTFYSKLQKVAGGELYPSSKFPAFWSCGDTGVQECANVFWCAPWLWCFISNSEQHWLGELEVEDSSLISLSLFTSTPGLFWNIQYLMTRVLFWKWMLKIEFNIFRFKKVFIKTV